LISCNGTELAEGAAAAKSYIQTVLRGSNIPRKIELPEIPPDPSFPIGGCGPNSEE